MTAIGLVGTGYWSETIHGPAIAARDDVARRGIWGRDPDARDRIATQLGLEPFETFEGLVAATDVVAFAVPPLVQARLAVSAAEAGRHLLLEKPMALSVSDARRVDEAVSRAGVRALVFLTRLFEPARGPWLREQSLAGHTRSRVRWISAALSPGSPYAASTWRLEGGALWDVGPHIVSQLEAVLGPVAGVTVESHEAAGVSRFTLHHATGASSEVEMTLHGDPADKTETFEFWGPRGTSSTPAEPMDFRASSAAALSALLRWIDEPAAAPPTATTTAAGVEMTAVLATLERVFQAGPFGVEVPVERT